MDLQTSCNGLASCFPKFDNPILETSYTYLPFVGFTLLLWHNASLQLLQDWICLWCWLLDLVCETLTDTQCSGLALLATLSFMILSRCSNLWVCVVNPYTYTGTAYNIWLQIQSRRTSTRSVAKLVNVCDTLVKIGSTWSIPALELSWAICDARSRDFGIASKRSRRGEQQFERDKLNWDYDIDLTSPTRRRALLTIRHLSSWSLSNRIERCSASSKDSVHNGEAEAVGGLRCVWYEIRSLLRRDRPNEPDVK